MTVHEIFQLITNVILLLLSADVLRAMPRGASNWRAAIFVFAGLAAFVGILGALAPPSHTDVDADSLAAFSASLLLIFGCQPVGRKKSG